MAEQGYASPIKSVGHGATCVRDICSGEEVWRVIYELSQDIGHRLIKHGLRAGGVSLTIRYSDLEWRIFQKPLVFETISPLDIASGALCEKSR